MDDDVRVGDPVVVGDLVLRPLARRTIAGYAGEDGTAAVGQIRPVGLIVETDEDVRAMDLDGQEIELGISWSTDPDDA